MDAVLLATLSAIIGGVGFYLLDQRVWRCGQRVRAVAGALLLAGGIWVVALIHFMLWLEVPGAYGPVQYWAVEDAVRMTGPRMLAVMISMVGFPTAGLLALVSLVRAFRSAAGVGWLRVILPLSATLVLSAGAYWCDRCGILPTA